MSMSSTKTTRRPKWYPTPPPPPSPKILNFPRRTRRKQPRNAVAKPPVPAPGGNNYRGRLEVLFDEERTFLRTVPIVLLNSGGGGDGERRGRVEEGEEGDGFGEEKWQFQAEILRAECNFLRVERKFALEKLERNRVQMERTLRSAVQTLISGRKKICDGKNSNAELVEEIEDLEDKLEELQRSSGVSSFEVEHCSNFDKKASLLQQQLEKLGGLRGEKCLKEIRERAEESFLIRESFVSGRKTTTVFTEVEVLRRKLEGLSKGMLDRMKEEYGSMLSSTANSSATSSASTSKRIEFPDCSSFTTRQPYQEQTVDDEKKCSGRCKAIVRRIVDQVRAETEQWSQMQEMLGQVRNEMEELQVSRDYWEDRALDSECEIQSLGSEVQEWRQRASTLETKASELQTQVSMLREELFGKLSMDKSREVTMNTVCAPLPLGAQIGKEKLGIIRSLKENGHLSDMGTKQEIFSMGRRKTQACSNGLLVPKRSPFKDVGNSSQKLRKSSKAIFAFPFG